LLLHILIVVFVQKRELRRRLVARPSFVTSWITTSTTAPTAGEKKPATMANALEASKKWHQGKPPRPRWMLHIQATFWRVLMGLGMLFHKLAPPRPPKPSFTRQIPSTISGKAGEIGLMFYVPKDYETQRRLWMNRPRMGSFDGAREAEEGGVGGLLG
jgi:hypothetical protein